MRRHGRHGPVVYAPNNVISVLGLGTQPVSSMSMSTKWIRQGDPYIHTYIHTQPVSSIRIISITMRPELKSVEGGMTLRKTGHWQKYASVIKDRAGNRRSATAEWGGFVGSLQA
jgi:hypothetical protein